MAIDELRMIRLARHHISDHIFEYDSSLDDLYQEISCNIVNGPTYDISMIPVVQLAAVYFHFLVQHLNGKQPFNSKKLNEYRKARGKSLINCK